MAKHAWIFVFILLAQKQLEAQGAYPKGYFANPLDIPIALAGNFGECRPGHFHSGLDIKTRGVENYPVHAAADGYVARIKMEKGGFGHALYVRHPNGYTTLYAHLNQFAPALQRYLHEQQYDQQKWDVDLELPPGKFTVKQGELIAWSGNTGGSTAPHLHFEIRNTATEHPLNPELFGFKIDDRTPPKLAELALYSGNTYEDSVVRLPLIRNMDTYPAVGTAARYHLAAGDTLISAWDSVGLGLNMDDFMDSSTNTLAPLTLQLFLDNKIQCSIRLDDIGYDETRYVNAYGDYCLHQKTGLWFQLFFCQPGNQLSSIYTSLNALQGRLNLADRNVHTLRIVVTDDANNTSELQCYLKCGNSRGIPKKEGRLFRYDAINSFSDADIHFSLEKGTLYNDIHFKYTRHKSRSALSDVFELQDASVPLHHHFDLFLRAHDGVPEYLRSKVALVYNDGESESGQAAADAHEGWYEARVRSFGSYRLVADTVPPLIKIVAPLSDSIFVLRVTDNVTTVKHFSGSIDGKWVCFEQHDDLFFFTFDEHCGPGKHELVFEAADENGNKRLWKTSIKR